LYDIGCGVMAGLTAQVAGLPPGTSFADKVQQAVFALDNGDTSGACTILRALIKEALAQSGKKLTPDQSAQLVADTRAAQSDIGCSP
jgi:hypothetical protein